MNLAQPSADPIAVGGLIVGVVSAIAAIVGAVAAIYAARYAKASPTKEDLERVERNTADSAKHIDAVRGHLAEQEKRGLLLDKAARVSISGAASGYATEPLALKFVLKDNSVKLLRIDLINRIGSPLGTFDCVPAEPLTFSTTIEPRTAGKWFNEGEMGSNLTVRLLRIRAYLEIDCSATSKEFSLTMSQSSQPNPPGSANWVQFLTVNGGC